jgi:hypothetical protein
MSKQWRIILESFSLIIIGVLVIAFCYIAYLMIYLSVEQLFYQDNVQQLPAHFIRIGSCLLLVSVYFWVLLTKLNDFIKAFLLSGPLTMIIVTVVLTYYNKLFIAVILVLIMILSIIWFSHKTKQVWYYYPIIVMSLIIGLLYAWPR